MGAARVSTYLSSTNWFCSVLLFKDHGTGNPYAHMRFPDYERGVETLFGWRLVGWPDDFEMVFPSTMSSGEGAAMKVLWDRLKDGECYWEKLPWSMHRALREKYKDFER